MTVIEGGQKQRPAHARKAWLVQELRSDHAGETGAVWIYRGILAVTRRDEGLRRFCKRHMATEQRHLSILEALLPKRQRSMLLPLWRVAGFVTGAIPALVSSRTVYVTIDAVERFVTTHYLQQVEVLEGEGEIEMAGTLAVCMADEQCHQREAAMASDHGNQRLDEMIRAIVCAGSTLGVAIARRL